MSTITLDRVCKVYERGSVAVSVLRDADLHVASGEFCVIMGPSGSGKSTLLNLVAGLDTVTSGAIRLDGQPTHGFSDAEWTRYRREMIGMVFQAFHLVPGQSRLPDRQRDRGADPARVQRSLPDRGFRHSLGIRREGRGSRVRTGRRAIISDVPCSRNDVRWIFRPRLPTSVFQPA